MSICAQCDAKNHGDARFCSECGARLSESAGGEPPASPSTQGVTCRACGWLNPPSHRHCTHCGISLAKTQPLRQPLAEGDHAFRVLRMLPDGRSEVYPLRDALVIGREEGDLRLRDDPYVSTVHARITREGGRYVLRDLHSRNGTFVRVRGEIELRPGDLIMIGGQVFKFQV